MTARFSLKPECTWSVTEFSTLMNVDWRIFSHTTTISFFQEWNIGCWQCTHLLLFLKHFLQDWSRKTKKSRKTKNYFCCRMATYTVTEKDQFLYLLVSLGLRPCSSITWSILECSQNSIIQDSIAHIQITFCWSLRIITPYWHLASLWHLCKHHFSLAHSSITWVTS